MYMLEGAVVRFVAVCAIPSMFRTCSGIASFELGVTCCVVTMLPFEAEVIDGIAGTVND